MTEEGSTTSHLSVAMTTTGTTQVTGGNTTASSSSRGVDFYFHIALIVIGIVGTAANGLILYALVASKQHKKHVLIVNQNVLDLFTSLMMVITYSPKLGSTDLTGPSGYWLCTVLLSDGLVWWGTYGSVINLAAITIDRYLTVVHRVWSANNLKDWMIYSAVAFSWIGSFVWNASFVFTTTGVINGACYPYLIVENVAARIFLTVWIFVSFYVIILFIFIVCYWRILVVIRRQTKVMAGHAGDGQGSAQAQIHKMQSNVVKTMIFVSALYAISWMPQR